MPKFPRVLVFSAIVFLLYSTAFSFDWPFFVRYRLPVWPFYVVGMGDVNGDSKADFAIAREGDTVRVYSGVNDSLLYKTFLPAGYFGSSAAGIGDVDGDGRADLIVGAPAAYTNEPWAGAAYVFSGATGTLLYEMAGTVANEELGATVAGVGDVDGDGKPDFAVGAPGLVASGAAIVYSGATGQLLYQLNGLGPGNRFGDRFGFHIADLGDVDSDGKADFIVAASFADPGGLTDAGSVYVYSGATGTVLYQKDGSDAGDELGGFDVGIAGIGDFNGDGKPDFVAGAAGASPGGVQQAGSAYVYSGADGSLLFQKNGTFTNEQFGGQVAGLGDVNYDGKPDIFIEATTSGYYNPSARIYFGAYDSLTLDDVNGGRTVGDVNGDRRDDMILITAASTLIASLRTVNIASVSDLPSDQGRKAICRWKNFPGTNDSLMDLFIVYLRLDSNSTFTGQKILTPDANPLPPGDWAQVAVVAATGDSSYTTIVPTLGDSTSEGTEYSVYFVRGRSTNPLLYIDSPLDSGYSVDNLVPSSPSSLAAVGTCQGNRLSYSRSVDADFRYFKIYRDTSASFASATVVGTSIDTFFVDAAPVSKNFFYRVSAVDFSGNEGGLSPSANALAGLKGDLNINAGLSPADVVLELNAVFLSSSFPAPFCVADVNCDGQLSPADVVIELNVVFLNTPITCTP